MTVKKAMVRSVGPAGLERIELKRLTERIGWLFSLLQEAVAAQVPSVAGTWAPLVDVCETTKAIDVRIELPGVNAAQIKLGLNGDKLRISGDKKKKAPRQRILSHHCSERTYGHFDRVIPLRWSIDTSNARAELLNGVLLIHLPKLTDRRGSEFRIPIIQKD
jgi:HSP20 family protein